MLTQRSFVHKTRRGRILNLITEHYLRSDIYCGTKSCDTCTQADDINFPQTIPKHTYPDDKTVIRVLCDELNKLTSQKKNKGKKKDSTSMSDEDDRQDALSPQHIKQFLSTIPNYSPSAQLIIIPDLSLFIDQYDLFETNTPIFGNIIVLQSILQFIQQKHYKIYQKVRALCNSAVFQSSTLLAPNFEPKSYSIANIGGNSDDQTVVQIKPNFHVFCDVFHSQVYTAAMKETQSASSEIYIPHGVDLHTLTLHGCEYSSHLHDNIFGDDETIDEPTPKFVIPSSSLVQFDDIAIDPDDITSSSSSSASKLDVTQSQELLQIEALYIATLKWYLRHNDDKEVVIIGLTNSFEKAQRSIELGLPILPVSTFTQCFYQYHPGLEHIVVQCAQQQSIRDKSKWVYKEHLSSAEIESGVHAGALYTGALNIDRDYWLEGTISTNEHGRVLIPGLQYMNRSFDGDVVAVRLWPKEQWVSKSTALAPEDQADNVVAKSITSSTLSGDILDDTEEIAEKIDENYIPADGVVPGSQQSQKKTVLEQVPTGEVVGIVQRGSRSFCGSIELTDKQDGQVLFLPTNRRIPKIFIKSKQLQEIGDARLLVRVDDWPITSHHPHGHITRILGQIGDNEAETEIVLIEHDIKHDRWSIDVEACLPPPDYVIDDQERAGRVDLRGVDICSIDPPGCTDIDDALHCIELPNGNYEVGVHIADVTHYMQPGSALDIEAAKRATSVYLVDRRIDMIPQRLSTNLCSLHEKVERLAFSTVWELHKDDASILNVKFFKSVILSRAAMTYAQAQERIDLELEDCTTTELKEKYNSPLTSACKNLMKLARLIKARRISQGALTLASTEVKFKMNANRTVAEDLSTYQLKETNSLVEEFMLLANVSVAEHILRHFPLLALLRGHPTPPEEMLLPLVKAAKSWGFNIDVTDGKALNDSLDKIIDEDNPMFNKVLRVLTTRCMTQAKYLCSGEIANLKQLHHFGLACTTYTHFTSPIRRYADVLVHRLLATSLGIIPLPEAIQDKAHMRDVVENLNIRHKQAQLASRASNEIWVLKYFTGKDIVTDAVILSVRSTGVRVIVSAYGIECALRLVPSKRVQDTITSYEAPVGDEHPKSQTVYYPDLMTLAVYGVEFKVLQNIKIRLSVKENNSRRRWLDVEPAGETRDLLPVHILKELESNGRTITPETMNQSSLNSNSLNIENDISDFKKPESDEDIRPMPIDQEVDDDGKPIYKEDEKSSTKSQSQQQTKQTSTKRRRPNK